MNICLTGGDFLYVCELFFYFFHPCQFLSAARTTFSQPTLLRQSVVVCQLIEMRIVLVFVQFEMTKSISENGFHNQHLIILWCTYMYVKTCAYSVFYASPFKHEAIHETCKMKLTCVSYFFYVYMC
jgi:hypothetical protein